MEIHNCTLLELAENYNFFEGMSRQVEKMVKEEKRNRRWNRQWVEKPPLREKEDGLLQFKKYVRGAKREKKLGVFIPLRFAEKLLRIFQGIK